MLSLAHSIICVVAATSALLLGARAQRYEQAAEERAPRYIAAAAAAGDSRPTPVPILKQVNRHNEDGSYTYGYEAADGSFKIETKLANGDVKGKYGYRDDTGKVRTVEYGADKYGFQPAGEGITVAAPTLVDEPAEQERRAGPVGPARAAAADYDYEEAAPPRPPPYRAPAARLHTAAVAAPRPPKPAFFAGAAPAPAPPADAGVAYFRPSPSAASARAQPAQQYSQNTQFGGQQARGQQTSQLFEPEPVAARAQQYPAQEYRTQQYPAQQYSTQPYSVRQQYAPAPAAAAEAEGARARPREPFTRLDELIAQYALPAGGAAPLHDITFGSY